MILRHFLAILVLPVTVTTIVPLWIARRYSVALEVPSTLAGAGSLVLGLVAAAIGGTLLVTSLYSFATRGRGTLAPWDPPRHLVVRGPYRYVRNPMIAGVIFLLVAEALVLRSLAHALWAVAFIAVNAIIIPVVEEPQLEARFGDEYREYRRHVRRFLPRLRPW